MIDENDMTPSSAYRIIKRRLMAGGFAGGQKLRPDLHKDEFGISASAMREVFLRLSHEHLLEQEEQRGFHVPRASERRLTELMQLRILLECEGARQAIEFGDIEWEARLNAAHYKLAHLETKMRATSDLTQYIGMWTRVDWEFHDTLLSACPSETLRQTHRNIYERFRQQVVLTLDSAGFREETLPEHEAILQAAITRDAKACCRALESHLQTLREDLRRQKIPA
ncbi:GntR family transcriptional regulator [Pinisolibacter sp.]|uniref:GntR family transcriptional regulator n=1 Tax=Pinisolibacter sp. TaxID=2172024 RepID=UPI002FDE6D5F